MMTCLQEQLEALRRQLLDMARHMKGARLLAGQVYGVGPLTAQTPWKSFPRLEGVGALKDAPMSPQRIDYYDDPDAPKANSLVPAVNVVVVNDAASSC